MFAASAGAATSGAAVDRALAGVPPATVPARLRTSGIREIGSVPWGTHFCQFYETRQDMIDILVPYFKAGLESGECCLWVTSEPLAAAEAEHELRRAVPDFDRHRDAGAIEIVPHTAWYLEDGAFDAQRVLRGWIEKLERAVTAGFAGLRLSGNTFWLERSGWRDFTEYEGQVNDVIGQLRMIAACTYSLDRCGALEIVDVIQNHHFALIKRADAWVRIEHSDRRRMLERLRRAELERVALEERGRLARELHDGPAQALWLAKLKAARLAGMIELGSEERALAEEVKGAIDTALAEARQAIIALRMASESGGSFAELMVRYLEDFEDRLGLPVEYVAEELPQLPARTQAELLRIVQEALTNVCRHARATLVCLRAGIEGDRLTLTIEDNGIGFDPAEAKGFGLVTMRERAALIGGELAIDTRPGAGTKVRISAPLRVEPAGDAETAP